MPEETDAHTKALIEQVLCFVEELHSGQDRSVHAFIAVQELLLGLAARGELPDDAQSLEGRLRPLLVCNRAEQIAFSARYREFFDRQRKGQVEVVTPSNGDAPGARRWEWLRRAGVMGQAVTLVILTMIAAKSVSLGVEWFRTKGSTGPAAPPVVAHASPNGFASPAPPSSAVAVPSIPGGMPSSSNAAPAPSPSGVQPDLDGIAPPKPDDRVLGLLALILLGGGVLVARDVWLRRRVVQFLSSGSQTKAGEKHNTRSPPEIVHTLPRARLGDGREISAAGVAMRRRVLAGSQEIDLPASMESTARSAGFFSEVLRERTRVPDYVFLLDRRNGRDFECARQDALLDELSARGVALKRWYFNRDGSTIAPPAGRTRSIYELSSMHHGHRVGIFAEADLLLDSFTGEIAGWMQELLRWTRPVLFSPAHTHRGAAVTHLEASGIRITSAEPQGLAEAFGSTQRSWRSRKGAVFAPAPPVAIRTNSRLLLGPDPPDPEVLSSYLHQLEGYLGPSGFLLLSASALYPELRYELTLGLGRELGVLPSETDPDLMRRLSLLPCMREARMPSWLRRRLLGDLSAQRLEEVKQALERVLVDGLEPGDSDAKLRVFQREPEIIHRIYRELTEAWQREEHGPSATDDAVFLGAMQDDLSVRVVRRVKGLSRRMRVELPPVDIVQRSYGAFLLGYLSQLWVKLSADWFGFANALPSTVFAGVALAVAFAALPMDPIRRFGFWRPIAHAAARSTLVVACMLGLALAYLDFGFGAGGEYWNLLVVAIFLAATGLPLVVFEDQRIKVLGAAVVAGGTLVYKVSNPGILWDLELPWTVFRISLHEQHYTTVIRETWPLFLVAASVSSAVALLAPLLPRSLLRLGSIIQDLADRFMIDRLLFDRQLDPPLPSSRTRTAFFAASFGALSGILLEPAWLDDLFWFPVISVAVSGLFMAFPFFATLRYRKSEGKDAEKRAAFEYLLVVGVALYAQHGWTTWMKGALAAAAMVSLLVCFKVRPEASPAFSVRLERLAPDRLLRADPVFLSLIYVGLLGLAGFFLHRSSASGKEKKTASITAPSASSTSAMDPSPRPSAAASAMGPLLGIDVTNHHGTVDWGLVRSSGITFAYARATDGTNTVDPLFKTNWERMRAAGLVRGAYHFFRPAQDANKQAQRFLETLGELQAGDLPPALDLEVSDGLPGVQVANAALVWLTSVEAKTKRLPLIYTGNFAKTIPTDALVRYPLWLAAYYAKPTLPPGWTRWTLWQFSDGRLNNPLTIKGVNTPDQNRFEGSRDDLLALGAMRSAGSEGAASASVASADARAEEAARRKAEAEAARKRAQAAAAAEKEALAAEQAAREAQAAAEAEKRAADLRAQKKMPQTQQGAPAE